MWKSVKRGRRGRAEKLNGPLWRRDSDQSTGSSASERQSSACPVLSAQFGSQKQCYLSNYYWAGGGGGACCCWSAACAPSEAAAAHQYYWNSRSASSQFYQNVKQRMVALMSASIVCSKTSAVVRGSHLLGYHHKWHRLQLERNIKCVCLLQLPTKVLVALSAWSLHCTKGVLSVLLMEFLNANTLPYID